MALDLAEPSTERLKRAPLSLVVCQVRHEKNLAAADAKRAVAIHDALKGDYETLEEQSAQDLTVQAGPLGVQTLPGETARRWRMRSKDEAWTVVVMPDFFSIETTSYLDWDDFKRRLLELTTAVVEQIDPALEQRIGLRFINQISHPEVHSPQDWNGRIESSFLGPILHESLGLGIEATQQVVQLDSGDGRNAIIRHGCYRDQEGSGDWLYAFDQDCSVQYGRHFDMGQVMDAVESLHTLALQVFQAALTPDLLHFFDEDES